MTTNRRIRTRAAFLLAAGLLSGAAVFTALSPAQATQPDPIYKVTICHRTNSVTNPYTSNTVDEAAVDGVANEPGNQQDHNGVHEGPVFDVTADPDVAYPTPRNGDQWGDIIPPFYSDGVTPGDWEPQNWDAAGQAIFFAGKGCEIPPEDPCPDDDSIQPSTYNPTTTTVECPPEETTTTTVVDDTTTTTVVDDTTTTTVVDDTTTTTVVDDTTTTTAPEPTTTSTTLGEETTTTLGQETTTTTVVGDTTTTEATVPPTTDGPDEPSPPTFRSGLPVTGGDMNEAVVAGLALLALGFLVLALRAKN